MRPWRNATGGGPIALSVPSQHHDAESNLLSAGFFTLPSERGRGVARALIEAVYEHAKAAGSQRVSWNIHESTCSGAVAIRQGCETH